MTDDEIFAYSWLLRVLERTSLSLIIITVSIILIVAFWRSLQKIDFNIQNEKNTISTNIVFATPIFVLIILVFFSYVSFSHPIKIHNSDTSNNQEKNSTERTYSGYGSSDKNELNTTIDALHKSEKNISDFILGDKKSIYKLTESSALLKVAVKDIVISIYGRELVHECRTSIENTETECLNIREWLK